ncbi:MAG: hypothetical protein AMXMBFR17_00370 [Candidatus Jettenia caeni]|nr:MAG: hypothetical protein JETCAE04_13430 [Candidatus Jettenia caeni]
MSWNGLTVNGRSLNGLTINGLSINGIKLDNGKILYGLRAGGSGYMVKNDATLNDLSKSGLAKKN